MIFSEQESRLKYKAMKDKELSQNVSQHIKSMGACGRFKGGSIERLVEQLFSPYGIEWVIKYGYPDAKTFAKFGDLSQYGIYINAGDITLSECERICLIGKTRATLTFEETKGYKVILLHGADATINASGFSVVRIEKDEISTIKINKSGFAKVLQ